MTGVFGQRRTAPQAAHVHVHLDGNPPVRRGGYAMNLDSPLLPGGRHILEVLTNALVPDVRVSADAQNRQELDLRVANGQGSVDIAAIDRVGKAPHGLLVVSFHPCSIPAWADAAGGRAGRTR